MPEILEISPFAGLNRRFPEHKITSQKKDGKQYLIELQNMLSLDGRFTIVGGATKYNASTVSGNCSWLKRIYYQDSGNDYRFSYTIIGGKMYKGDDSTGTISQVTISGSLSISIDPSFYPIDATLKVGGQVCTFLVDGTYFYKFVPNAAGNWERLPILNDIDGNPIEPTYNCEWLDRQWVIVKGRNVVLGSANLNPESFDNATDSILIELPPGNGGCPRALIKYRGTLYVWHDDYFAPITGSSASTFGVRPGDIAEGVGTSAPRSVILVNNQIGFLNSKDNEYYLTSGTLDSTDETPLSYPIKLGELMHPTESVHTVCIHDSDLNCLRIAYYLSGGTYLGSEEIYSFAEKKWCGQTRGRNISAYSQWDGLNDDGRLTTGRSDVGCFMVNDNSINFDGAAIHYKWVSGSYCFKDPLECTMEAIFIDAKPQGNTTVNVAYYLDGRITTYANENVNQQGEVFNLGLIDIADQLVFLNRFTPFIDKSKGRMVRFQIEGEQLNTLLEFYSIYAFFSVDDAKFSKYISGR